MSAVGVAKLELPLSVAAGNAVHVEVGQGVIPQPIAIEIQLAVSSRPFPRRSIPGLHCHNVAVPSLAA